MARDGHGCGRPMACPAPGRRRDIPKGRFGSTQEDRGGCGRSAYPGGAEIQPSSGSCLPRKTLWVRHGNVRGARTAIIQQLHQRLGRRQVGRFLYPRLVERAIQALSSSSNFLAFRR